MRGFLLPVVISRFGHSYATWTIRMGGPFFYTFFQKTVDVVLVPVYTCIDKMKRAKKKANAKYDKIHTKLVVLKLNIRTDADILDKLDQVGNKQGYIKQLIRKDIE